LRIALGEALDRAGTVTGARRTFAAAAEEARALGAGDLLARAALGHAGLGIVIAEPRQDTVAALEGALAALADGDDTDRARVCGRLAVELIYADRARSRALGAEAVVAGRRARDKRALAYALIAQHAVLWDPDHLEERLAITAELAALATELEDRELRLQGVHWRAVDRFEAGDMGGFRAAVEEHVTLADALALPAYQWYGPLWRAVDATLAGRYRDAERLGDEALVLGRRAGDANAELFREILSYHAIEQQARFPEFAIDRLRARVATSAVPGAWRCGLAWILAETGRTQDARRELDLLATAGFSNAPRDPNWLVFVAECGETCSLLGAAEHAEELYDLLLPFAERNVTAGRAIAAEGSAHRVLGLLAAVMGRLDVAVEHLDAAVAANARMGLEPFVVRAKAQLVPVLRARGDLDRAGTLHE
jgi:tetratricopeptide (TPR) repeat protein